VVKVFKSVGAVRVYNPLNAVGILIGLALLVLGAGFAIGWFANNDSGGSSGSSAAVSDTAGRQAAYNSGLAAGRRQGAATAASKASKATPATKATPAPKAAPVVTGSFKSGTAYALGDIKKSGAYFVQVDKGHKGLRIGPTVSATAGHTYWVCGDRVCYR
jgi:hypothetical protein